MANGTFYMHFADKQAAFLDFAAGAQEEMLALLDQQLTGVAGRRERWKVICNSLIDFSSRHPGLLQAAFHDPVVIAPNNENAWHMYDRLGHLVSLALKDENLPATVNVEMISHGICGFLRQSLIYAGRRNLDRAQLIEDISEFIDRGLGAPPQQSSLQKPGQRT